MSIKTVDDQFAGLGGVTTALDKVVLSFQSVSGRQQHHILTIDQAMEFVAVLTKHANAAMEWKAKST